MGRVYDALRRAGTDRARSLPQLVSYQIQHLAAKSALTASSPRRQQIEEQLFSVSSILARAEDAGEKFSVHCAHCECIRRDGTPRRNSLACCWGNFGRCQAGARQRSRLL